MKTRGYLVCLTVIFMGAGCYESEFPLDPAPGAALDAGLLGTWRCLSAEPEPADKPADMNVGRARDGVYAISLSEDGKESDSYEAFASVVRGRPLLNVREVGPSASQKWVFVRYVFLRPSVLQVQVANGEALKAVEKSAAAVRRAIEREGGSSTMFVDLLVCVRGKAGRRS